MPLFKDVKKPVIKKASPGDGVTALRPRFVEKRPPCAEKCPAGSDVRGWLTSLAAAEADGRTRDEAYDAAWRTIVETNPFPSTLGRICPHPCEAACNRAAKDEAVAVNVLEGFVGDLAIARGLRLARPSEADRLEKIAIVGAGPAGLSCAYQLARRGCRPVVLEGRELAGGRLRDGVRTGRVPAAVVDVEIARIEDLGVDLRVGTPVDDRVVDELRREYRAVFVAVGRPTGTSLPGLEETRAAASLGAGGDAAEPMLLFATGDGLHQGLVAAAIAQGRLAAVAIDAWLTGTAADETPPPPTIAAERLKLEWYKAVPRHDWKTVPAPAADGPGWQVLETEVAVEAARC
jgi:NADPH-dependent glutamate synthase beta subunit-like oxidoreductase